MLGRETTKLETSMLGLEPTKLEASMLTITQLMWSIHVLMKLCIYFYSGFPEKVLSILQFINEVHTFYRQQRSLLKPVMVHCRSV